MTPATTSATAAPVAMIFSFNDDFLFRALDGLTPPQLWQRPTERNNPMAWVAGHLVQSRATVLRLLGDPVDTGWGSLFDRGATIGETSQYPPRDEIERVMREVTPRLHAKLASLDDASLARPASFGLPFAKTLSDELAFFALHESYTVGQLSYIRKALGYPGLAG
jgi:DinB superfamily